MSGLETLDAFGGIAGYYGAGVYITGYHRSGADNTVVADVHSRCYDGIATNPDIMADCYRLGPFSAGVALIRSKGMAGGVNRYIRTDKTVVAYCHKSFVKNCKIEVGKKILKSKSKRNFPPA